MRVRYRGGMRRGSDHRCCSRRRRLWGMELGLGGRGGEGGQEAKQQGRRL